MALNPFFLQGSPGEQSLVQDLVNEHLRMFGIEVYYIPRKQLKTTICKIFDSTNEAKIFFEKKLPIN